MNGKPTNELNCSDCKKKIHDLEKRIMRILFVQQKIEMDIQNLQNEVQEFKHEMKTK